MLSSEKVVIVLNGVIESIRQVVPSTVSVEFGKPSLIAAPVLQSEVGVLVGITGDVSGRILIEGTKRTFGKLGETMYGMLLEGEMMLSFAGEMSNMIAGNTSRIVFAKDTRIDITPPTVMEGESKLYGFSKALNVPITIESIGELQIILMLEE